MKKLLILLLVSLMIFSFSCQLASAVPGEIPGEAGLPPFFTPSGNRIPARDKAPTGILPIIPLPWLTK